MRMVSAAQLLSSADFRIDPHYYALRGRVDPLLAALAAPRPLNHEVLESVGNGLNVGAGIYTREDEDAGALYASVGAVSSYVLQPAACTGLRIGDGGLPEVEAAAQAASTLDVLITRSGTPGIAWTLAADSSAQDAAQRIIPSGFMIRLRCRRDELLPEYLSAILNHPVWRVWTSALAAGKRQRNLSQEHLRDLRIPSVGLLVQEKIGGIYVEALKAIEEIISEPDDLSVVCDAVLLACCGLYCPSVATSIRQIERASLRDIIESRVLRIDFRHLRSDFRSIGAAFDALPTTSLGELVSAQLRRSQPRILPVDDQQQPRVVATSSIQSGQVVELLTKQCDDAYFAEATARQLAASDLLVALDGDGSIGKAAVFNGEFDAVCDSHVLALRLIVPDQAAALSCLLNSTYGQAYVQRYASGSTGQIQLAPEDLAALRVPNVVVDKFKAVGDAYRAKLATFKGRSDRIKDVMCTAAAAVSSELARAGALKFLTSDIEREYLSGTQLRELLNILKPRMF